MKIRVNDLPDKGLVAQEVLPEQAINARLQEPDGNQFFFTAPLACEVLVTPLGTTGATVQGTVKGTYTQGCSLCLDNVPRELDRAFTFQLRRKEAAEQAEDDVGIFYFEGDHVELDAMIEEEIILSLSIFWHPPFQNEQCTICTRSKKSLGLSDAKSGPNLGELLVAAQKKTTH